MFKYLVSLLPVQQEQLGQDIIKYTQAGGQNLQEQHLLMLLLLEPAEVAAAALMI